MKTGTGQRVGYVRVSTVGQNTARQLDGVKLDKIFEDKCSGSSTDRPALQALLSHVREGDVVVVHEISRLARNTTDLLALVHKLNRLGVAVEFMKESLTFEPDAANPMSQLMLTLLGAVASFELALINERRLEGQAQARAAGKHMGRHEKLSAEQKAELKQRAIKENKTVLAKEYGVSRTTLYTVLAE